MLKNAFISEIMSKTLKMYRGKIVQREISYQISLLKFWMTNIITESWRKAHEGYRVKMRTQGLNEKLTPDLYSVCLN